MIDTITANEVKNAKDGFEVKLDEVSAFIIWHPFEYDHFSKDRRGGYYQAILDFGAYIITPETYWEEQRTNLDDIKGILKVWRRKLKGLGTLRQVQAKVVDALQKTLEEAGIRTCIVSPAGTSDWHLQTKKGHGPVKVIPYHTLQGAIEAMRRLVQAVIR
jgi:hypothetical protein